MSRAAEFRSNAEQMMRMAEAAELPAVRERYLRAARTSQAIAERLERSTPRAAKVQEQALASAAL